MKIFVYEHVTGGGMTGEELPPGLACEADLMLRALVSDLFELDVEVLASRDSRLPALHGVHLLEPGLGEPPARLFARGLEAADAVWPTAPESGGLLESFARQVLAGSRELMGSRPDGVRVATSKRATSRCLRRAGVPVVDSWSRHDSVPLIDGPWVVKPDDGAGCEGVRRLPDRGAAIRALVAGAPGLVAQPWIEGEPRSLCVLCADGRARVLSVNRQRVGFTDEVVGLEGLEVGAVSIGQAHREIASGVAAAIPGLWGCVGIDFIEAPSGITVLEVNPRLTTSFAALHRATGLNPARLTLALCRDGGLGESDIDSPALPVELQLGGLHAG